MDGEPEDWAAVAAAIHARLTELGMRQWELAERARVSQATVRELQWHTVERRRSGRTLAALSAALAWHPEYLASVLRGQQPPAVGHGDGVPDTLGERLAAIEDRLQQITSRLDAMHVSLAALASRSGRTPPHR